jgi:hypothetical protein
VGLAPAPLYWKTGVWLGSPPAAALSGCEFCDRYRRSSRGRSCSGQYQCVTFDDQPPLGGCVCTGQLEVRHLPIANLGCLSKIIQHQRIADATALGIYDNIQQLPANCFGRLVPRWLPIGPTRPTIPLCDMFSHAAHDSDRDCYWPVARDVKCVGSQTCELTVCLGSAREGERLRPLLSVLSLAGRQFSCWP